MHSLCYHLVMVIYILLLVYIDFKSLHILHGQQQIIQLKIAQKIQIAHCVPVLQGREFIWKCTFNKPEDTIEQCLHNNFNSFF